MIQRKTTVSQGPRCLTAMKLSVLLTFLFPCGLLANVSSLEVDLPQAVRIISVDSSEKLKEAIEQALPGDRIVLEDGSYDGILLKEVRGTVDQPIVFTARHSRQAIIAGSLNGRNAKLTDCAYLHIDGLRFTGGEVWGVTIGPAYVKDDKTKGCMQIHLIDCEVDHAGQSLLKINGNSSGIRVLDSDFHHSGNLPSAHRPYAEGIYIGEGASKQDRSHDILIQGNRLKHIGNADNWGEAIDVKCQVSHVRIVGNTIEDVTLHSGGAITALFDPVDFPDDATDPDIEISGNVIRNVRKLDGGWGGAGICVGANGVTVHDNIVSDTEGPALLVLKNAGNTTDRLVVVDNQFEGEISINEHGNGWLSQPVTVELSNVQAQEETLGNL